MSNSPDKPDKVGEKPIGEPTNKRQKTQPYMPGSKPGTVPIGEDPSVKVKLRDSVTDLEGSRMSFRPGETVIVRGAGSESEKTDDKRKQDKLSFCKEISSKLIQIGKYFQFVKIGTAGKKKHTYGDFSNTELLSEISEGRLNGITLYELIKRIESKTISAEDLTILLPEEDMDTEINSVAAQKVVKAIIKKGLSDAASNTNSQLVILNNIVLVYPTPEEVKKIIAALLGGGHITELELIHLSKENKKLSELVNSVIEDFYSSPEYEAYVENELVTSITTKLERIAAIFSMALPTYPKVDEGIKQALLTSKFSHLLASSLNASLDECIMAFVGIIEHLKTGKTKIKRIVSVEEKSFFRKDQNHADFDSLHYLILMRLKKMVIDMEDPKTNFPTRDIIINIFATLIRENLITVPAIRREPPEENLDNILQETLTFLESGSSPERPSAPNATLVGIQPPAVAAASSAPESDGESSIDVEFEFDSEAAPASEPTPEPEPTPAPTPESTPPPYSKPFPKITPPSEPVPDRPSVSPTLPSPPLNIQAPEVQVPQLQVPVSLSPSATPQDKVRLGRDITVAVPIQEVQSHQGRKVMMLQSAAQTRPSSVPESIPSKPDSGPMSLEGPDISAIPLLKKHPNPDKLVAPVLILKTGDEEQIIPLMYSRYNVDEEGYHIFDIGSYELGEVFVSKEGNPNIREVHTEIRIRGSEVKVRQDHGITRLRGKTKTLKGWHNLLLNEEIELGAVGTDTSFKIVAAEEIDRSFLQEIMTERIDELIAMAQDEIEQFHDESDEMKDINTILTELENVDIQWGLYMSESDYTEARRVIMEPRREYKAAEQKKHAEKREAEAKREAKENARREAREADIEARRESKGLKELYIHDSEDPKKVPIAWTGCVLAIQDTTKGITFTKPMITRSRTFGSHVANTDQLPKPDKPIGERERLNPKDRRLVHEFMAEIEIDPENKGAKLLVTHIGGKIEFNDKDVGKYGDPTSKEFRIEEGDSLRIGPYIITVLGWGHGYSPLALKDHAQNMINESIERIFDVERTTAQQDYTDHRYIEQILEIFSTKEGKKEEVEKTRVLKFLKQHAATKYKEEFEKLWEQVLEWNPENPTYDAKIFPTIKLLLDLSEEPGTFIEELGVEYKDLVMEADRRVKRYLEAGEDSHPFKETYGIGRLIQRLKNLFTKKKRKQDSQVAERGAIEIARFIHELEFFPEAEVNISTSAGYGVEINMLLTIRRLFSNLEDESGDPVRIIRILLGLCKGKKLSDVFSEEEIKIRNLDIELSLEAEKSMRTDYIAPKAKFAARKAWKRALEIMETFDWKKDDPAEFEKNREVVEGILKMGEPAIIHIMDLRDDSRDDKLEQDIRALLSSMKEKVEWAKRRLAQEAELKAQIEQQQKEELDLLYVHNMERNKVEGEKNIKLIKQAIQIMEVLDRATRTTGSLSEMLKLNPLLEDKDLAARAKKYSFKTTGEEIEIKLAVKQVGGKSRKVKSPSHHVSTETIERSWDDIKDEWKEKIIEIGIEVAKEAEAGDPKAYFKSLLLKKLVSSGTCTYEELGTSEEALQWGITKAKFVKFRDQVMSTKDIDFSYLDEPYFEDVSNDTQKSALEEWRSNVTAKRIQRCIERIKIDDQAYLMMLVANKALKKDSNAADSIIDADLALLQ